MITKLLSLDGVSPGAKSLNKNLSHQIKNDILDERFKRGQKLTEQEICEKYNVSRTPVREAFFQLESEGLIEIIPNRGAFVVGLSAQDRVDIHIMRSAYEVQATEWAIERITPTQLDDLTETLEFMEFYTMKEDYTKMLTINSHFHQIIYIASGNRLLQHVLTLLHTYVSEFVDHEAGKKYLPEILEEHKEIYHAFLTKDPIKGGEAMKAHIENSAKRKVIYKSNS